MTKLKIIVFLSSVRQERLADRILILVNSQLEQFGFETIHIDPLIEKLDMINIPFHFYPSADKAPDNLKCLNEKITSGDAFVIISTEYNCTIPPALTNIIDHFPPNVFKFKPVGIVSYSVGQGGMVACNHIVSMMTSMGSFVQPMMVNISMAGDCVSVDGKTDNGEIIAGLKLLCEQLHFSGWAYKNHKAIEKTPNANIYF